MVADLGPNQLHRKLTEIDKVMLLLMDTLFNEKYKGPILLKDLSRREKKYFKHIAKKTGLIKREKRNKRMVYVKMEYFQYVVDLVKNE